MEPRTTYEYLTRARARLLDWARPLSAEQHARAFEIGRGTLASTLTHILISEWYYIRRIRRDDVPAYEQWPIKDEHPPAFAAIESAWADQASLTRETIAAVRDWNERLDYPITNDDGRREIVSPTLDDVFTQLVLHEVHHRSHAMNILRRLGVPAMDLDYNTLMYPRRPAGSSV